MGSLDGKVAIVTGGGRGVGRGIALALAKEGAAICIAEIDPGTVHATAEEVAKLGVRSLGLECDVTARERVEAVVDEVASELGRIDILINNATGARPDVASLPLMKHTPEQFQRLLSVDVLGSFHCMQACFPHLRESGAGRIVNLSSSAGTTRGAGFAAYAAAKEALRGLTGVAAREWGRFGITANSLCPQASTPELERWAAENPEVSGKYLADVALGRYGRAEEDIGRVVAFLCSDAGGYITGQTLMVDGGGSIHA